MTTTSYSALMIELDCLVDTRFNIIKSFGDQVFVKAFDEDYYTRKIDQFNSIPTQEFKKRYSNRNKTLLKDAAGTPLVQFVHEFVNETNNKLLSSPHHFIPKVVINSYPYVLTEEEQDLLIRSMIVVTEEKAAVEVICKSKEALTPAFVKAEFSIMVMYDYYQWLEIHSLNENFKKVTCPEITLIGPAIFFEKLPSGAEIKEAKENNLTPFKAMEISAGPIVNLVLLPIENFSLALKLKRHKGP